MIGITSSIASDDGGYQGIGFAVPANLVKRLVESADAEPYSKDASKKPSRVSGRPEIDEIR